jgi:hypothetical protein
MIAALVGWSFGALARRLPVYLYYDIFCLIPVMETEEARTATRFWLALVSSAIARWSSDLLVFFITFGHLCTDVNDY